MKMSKVLLLVEGEKKEVELLSHFYRLYEENDSKIKPIKIVSFKTDIYTFYNELEKFAINEEIDKSSIDLPLFLNDYHGLQGDEQLNSSDFIEKIVVFDYDPQSDGYKTEKLKELMEIFSDSTTVGKLYLNYPMLESYKDMESLDDKGFMRSTTSLEILKQKGYKKHVGTRLWLNRIKDIDIDTGSKLIDLHHQKLDAINQQELSLEDKYTHLCSKQCEKLEDEKLIWVVNTSILHLFDEYGPLET